MLVLMRQRGSETYLDLPTGERITITVIETNGILCRLGFDAPKSVRIIRDNAVVQYEAPNANEKAMADWKEAELVAACRRYFGSINRGMKHLVADGCGSLSFQSATDQTTAAANDLKALLAKYPEPKGGAA